MCNAKKHPRPSWFKQYQLLVTLIAAMTDSCTLDTYDALKVNSNPAEFIHVFCTHERTAPAPGKAGTGRLSLLHADPVEATSSPDTAATSITLDATSLNAKKNAPMEVLPLKAVSKPQEASAIDYATDDVQVVPPREPA